MSPNDVIASASVPGHPGLYVLGAYDTRITLYSQQVRALELAHALERAHHVTTGSHVAVIGGGAAGVTIAAAVALQGAATVHLFERSRDLMPLQSGASRRRLDPHIYGWPEYGADNEVAELPILDWRSGPATEVRAALLQEFGEIRAAVGDRLALRAGHDVTEIEPGDRTFEVRFQREDGVGGRQPGATTVDAVVLAIGFGLERRNPLPGVATESYWLDAGVPGADIEGRLSPGVLVSGSGDGGLIDLVAAASRDFDHGAMIRTIVRRPGVGTLAGPLAAIDARARQANAVGAGFDFISAYDSEIGDLVDRLGLTDAIGEQLRPRVRLHLQTREPLPLSIATATLNRLAVYLVQRASSRTAGTSFQHLVCDEVRSLPPGDGPDAAAYALDCGGRRIEVDRVIARRGPNRDAARLPFADALRDYATEHERWISAFPDEAIAPVLGHHARQRFQSLAREAGLPPPRHRRDDHAVATPRRIRVALHDGEARWTGDLPVAGAAAAWSAATASLALTIDATPAQLGPLAHPLARLALHGTGLTMNVDVPRWTAFLERLTTGSRDAEGLDLPALAPIGQSSNLNEERMAPDAMAASLGAALDRWCLARIDEHLDPLLRRGADPGHLADLAPATDVGQAMQAAWTTWKAGFDHDPALLARFLRLLVCARDGDASSDVARTLAGPRGRKAMIRATAAALAVAAGWDGLAPAAGEPGNLAVTGRSEARTCHACAAERIDGQPTSTRAATFLWRTDLVVLPMLSSPVPVAVEAEEPFNALDAGEQRLDAAGGGRSMLVSLDPRFKAAVSGGVRQVADLLIAVEREHEASLAGAIQRNGSGR